MNHWIEVTSGIRWNRLLREGVALQAPNKTRYRNFFKDLKANDVVLHYLTSALTPEKKLQSRIVGVSQTASSPLFTKSRISVQCFNLEILHTPIHLSELIQIKPKSNGLKALLRVNMQRYLTKISKSDFESIIDLHPENRSHIYARGLFARANY